MLPVRSLVPSLPPAPSPSPVARRCLLVSVPVCRPTLFFPSVRPRIALCCPAQAATKLQAPVPSSPQRSLPPRLPPSAAALRLSPQRLSAAPRCCRPASAPAPRNCQAALILATAPQPAPLVASLPCPAPWLTRCSLHRITGLLPLFRRTPTVDCAWYALCSTSQLSISHALR